MITGVDTATAYTQRNETTRDSACEIRRKRELKEIRSLVYGHRQHRLGLVFNMGRMILRISEGAREKLRRFPGTVHQIFNYSLTVFRVL